MNLDDLIKLAGVAKSQADTPVQEQPVDETDGMRTLIALVTPEQLNKLTGEAPVAEEMPGEATTEPDPQPYEGPLGSPADLSLRRYLGANGQPVHVDETKVYEDHKVEDITEAWKAYKVDEKKAKPDYIDLDGDGDKEESMKKAAKDKKAKADESVEEAKVEEEPNEGNAFTGAMAGKKKGEQFKVGDKTYTKEQQRLAQLAGMQVDEAPFPGEYDYTDSKYMDADGTPKSGPDMSNPEVGHVMAVMKKYPEEVEKMKATGDMDTMGNLYQALVSMYSDEMPYGTMKARDGDPVEWIMNKLDDLDLLENKVAEQEAEVVEDENINMLKQLAGI